MARRLGMFSLGNETADKVRDGQYAGRHRSRDLGGRRTVVRARRGFHQEEASSTLV
jgi:hypothetical protein